MSFWTGQCTCDGCAHVWIGVVETDDSKPEEDLECPKCGEFLGRPIWLV